MKRNVSQAGSLSAIVIGILFVALMATLGVVFYQNFIQEKPEVKPQQTVNEPTGDTMKTARAAFDGVIYAFDYPDNWKQTQEPAGTSDRPVKGTQLTIASPTGKIAVKFLVDAGSANSLCDKADGRKISSYDVVPKANLRLTGAPLSLVEALYDHLGGGYDYVIGLTPDSGAAHASVGETACNVTNAGVISAYRKETKENAAQPRMLARITFPQLLSDNGKPASPDMQTIKDVMATDEYKAAAKILESGRKE